MSAQATEKKSPVRIAVPYYGQLVRLGAGIEKIYFIAEMRPGSWKLRHISLRVWDPAEAPDLAKWLKKKRVCGVICSDTTLKTHCDFATEGIWVMGGQKGEVADVIRRWIAGLNLDAVMLAGPSYGNVGGVGDLAWFAARTVTAGVARTQH